MKNKYFYIIQRNGLIIEKEFDLVTYEYVFREWQREGIIGITLRGQNAPVGINAKDVVSILTAEAYRNYIATARPRQYIIDGVWYDSKEGKEIRVEEWKRVERLETKEKQRALKAADTAPLTPKQRKNITRIRKEISARFGSRALKPKNINCVVCGSDMVEASKKMGYSLNEYCSSECMYRNQTNQSNESD